LCLSNKLNFYYYYRFLMKHLLHFNELWTIYHFMSIQTTDVACIWRCLLWFLIQFCYLCGYHCGLLLIFARLHIMINCSIICVLLVNLPCFILCFRWCYLFSTLWYWKWIPCFYNSHAFFT
jgi:hypothetical protein